MMRANGNDSTAKKTLRILLPILYLVLLVLATAAFVKANWAGLCAILAGAILLGLSGQAKLRTIGAYYDPAVEGGNYKSGAEMEHRPEDVPLNPWDQMETE